MMERNDNKKVIDAKYLEHYPITFKNIPFSWSPAYIEDITLNVQPGFASGEHNQNGVGIPHIRPMNISRLGTIDLSEVKYVSADRSNLRLNKGNILFNNTNSPTLIGKTAAIQNDKNWSFSNHMTRLTIHSEVDYRFIFYQLHYLWMCGYYQNRCVHHVNQASISSKVFVKTVPVVIPSSNEQIRIIEKIEELFSDLDNGIESLKTAQKQLKVYRQAVLKWAFEGKLTEEWRKQNSNLTTAKDLLDQIEAEREKLYQQQLIEWKQAVKDWEANSKLGKKPTKPQKPKDLQPLTEVELSKLSELPNGWCWVVPEDICSPENYSLGIGPFGSNLKVSDYTESGMPLIFVRHITSRDFDIDAKYVSQEKFQELLPHSVKPLDLLITKMGDPPGDCEIYPQNREEGIITSDCLKLRIWDELLNRKFYKYCINSNLVKKQLGLITKGVAQKKISLERFKSLKFPLPLLEEQNQIVQKIESRLSICDRLEETITTNLKKAEALRQSILKRAFEGKLVPQDPNDEPAEKLLERIRAERQQTQQTQPTKQLTIKGILENEGSHELEN